MCRIVKVFQNSELAPTKVPEVPNTGTIRRFGYKRYMDQERAIETFAALALDSRLAIFRLLVREEPLGLPVGEISRRLDIVPSTLSGHLGVLKRAGLLQSTRHQREIHYATDLAAMSDLVRFMLEDCCNGRVENCSEIVSLIGNARKRPGK